MAATAAPPPGTVPADLAPMDVARRLDRLRASFERAGVEALLVSHLIDIRYLTGFTGSSALLLVGTTGAVITTDGRYRDQAAEQLAAAGVAADLVVGDGSAQQAALTTAAPTDGRLGLQADHVTWAQQRRYADGLFDGTELVPTSGLVEELRIVKDAGEVARIRAASAVADAALSAIRSHLLESPTEAEFGLELDTTMRQLGASGPSFETIVASGPNGAMPHHRPSGRRITDGDLVVLDFGALVDGYCSDMTRTIAVGDVGAEARRMLEVVGASQEAGVAAVRPGATCAQVDQACRDVIEAAGWGQEFVHSTGHGVGLEIHEAPRVASTSTATLAAGHVVTVEPGVYLTGRGGVRIEDTVLVTAAGCEPLTLTPKHTAVS